MYHKKIGILEDANKKKIVFSGSMNLTRSAIVSNKYFAEGNSEEFSVYPSWKNEIFEAYGTPKINDFRDNGKYIFSVFTIIIQQCFDALLFNSTSNRQVNFVKIIITHI